jgi:ankyrin repeat protein
MRFFMKNMTKCFLVTLALVAGSFQGGLAMNEQLIDAASMGDDATVDRLLTEGADVDAQDSDGNTALMGASFWGYMEVVHTLLNARAKVNVRSKLGDTALIIVAEEGHTEFVRTLLAVDGIKVNTQNKSGQTALMVASLRGHTEIVRMLLKARADITLKNKDGKTALDLAREKREIEIVQLFERYLEAIHDCVADEWRNGLPAGGQCDCPLEVIKAYIMPFLDPDQK